MNISINTAAINRLIKQKTRMFSDEELGKIVRGIGIRAYRDVARETPQWSGHMAANVTITVDGKAAPGTMEMLREFSKDDDPKRKGDEEARGISDHRNSWINSHPFTKRSKISIGYSAEPLKSYYAQVEAGLSTSKEGLRSVNRPGQALARALAKVQTKFNNFEAELYKRDEI